MASTKNRARRPPRALLSTSRRPRWRWLLVFCGAAVLLVAGALVGVFFYYTADSALPTIDRVGDYRPKAVTRVLGRDGQLIGEIFEERRTVVPRERIPRVLVSAIVDAEDAQFFQHKGLNYRGMLKALLDVFRSGGHLRGASTITQQLVKTYVLKSGERTLRRKVQEMYLATRLERMLDKEEILWIYLNQIYFGHNRYGVEEAARFYFGKSVSEISTGEAALLASLPKGPEEISPRHNPERAKDRQRYVLSQMVRYQHISKEEGERAANEPIRLIKEPAPLGPLAPEFVEEAERALIERHGARQLPYLGLNVRTTCDVEVQRAARAALEGGLQRLDERAGNRGRLRHLGAPQREEHLRRLRDEFPKGPPPSRIVEGVVRRVFDGENHSAPGALVDLGAATGWLPLPVEHGPDRYNPKGLPPSRRFGADDVLRVRVTHVGKEGPVLALENGPQGAAVVLDPDTRQVLALVGGYGYVKGSFDRALRARRQPGSAFKPVLYAAAFQSHKYTPASILNDSPQVYDLPGMAPWKPHNAEQHEYLGPVRLRVALAKSLNTVASQLIYDLKPEEVIPMARALGIESELEANYSLALGSAVVTPLELGNAYATLAARGRRGRPFTILQLGDEPPHTEPLAQAISPELAFQMASVMQSVFEEGTAISARGKLKRPAAGKTGTTNAQKDAWFIGFTPDLVAAVWVGYDDMRVLGEKEQGARAALPIWVELMQAALRRRPVVSFVQPAGVVVARIDPQTGKLAAEGGQAIDEVFLDGTQPAEQALAPGESDPSTFNVGP